MPKRKVRTLIEMLQSRAREMPEKIAFTFHKDLPCTYGNLWEEINRFACYLLNQGLRNEDRVLIAVPNSVEFFYAFYGVLRAGGIAVPVFPGSRADRILKLADLCAASSIVISQILPESWIAELKKTGEKKNINILFVEESSGSIRSKMFPEIHPHDIAFIQYTSGSTGNPKGVKLNHSNLITNMEQMISGMEITEKDVFVSWLPVYHDMGLILKTMVPFYLGADLVLLPTGLLHIRSWIGAIQKHRATFTAAPDFAYRLCLIYITEPEKYDLSSLRVALNAAEPVRASTIYNFEEKFNIKNVMMPAYGLAESTVGVSSWPPGTPIKVDSRGFVSIGTPFPGVEMKIIRNSVPAKDGEIGEMFVKSKANTKGYYKNPEATGDLFCESGFIRTGDMGYFDKDGDYFIVGRKKNIIIQSGHNIAAREVEELVEALPFVRRSAAVGIDRGGAEGEQAYIFIEMKLSKSLKQNDTEFSEMIMEVVQCFNNGLGFRPGRVYLMKPRSIPMTHNGKIKYPLLKEQYMDKSLKEKGLILYPAY